MAGPKRRVANAGGSQHGGSQSSKAASQASWAASDRSGALGEVRYAMEQVQYLIFGVGLIAIKDTFRSFRWRIIDQLVHYMAILVLPFSVFWWGYNDHPRHTQDWGGPFKPIHRYLVHLVKFEGIPFSDYQPVWLVTVLIVCLSTTNLFYVGYAFRTHRFRFKFPLRYLRIAGHVLPSVLFVPGVAILVEPFDCPLGSIEHSMPHVSFNAEWKVCWAGKHAVYAAISAIALILLVFQCILFVMFFYETNPQQPGAITARVHARAELMYLFAMLLNVVGLEITAIPHMAIGLIGLGCGLLCLYTVFNYFPFYRMEMNQLRAGVFMAFAWVYLLIFIEGRYIDSLRAHADPVAYTVVMIVGMPAFFAFGWWLSKWYFSRYLCTGRMFGLELRNAWHVELATRFLLADASPASVEIADQIYRKGLEVHQHSAAVRICYGRFLLKHSENGQAGFRSIEEAAKFDPFFDVSFQVFRAMQERIQQSQGSTMGSQKRKHVNESEELIEHLEFQKDIAGAKKYHKAAVRAFKKFWSCLIAEDITLAKVESAVKQIDLTESRAQQHYKALIARHPNHPRILRSYGQFHEEVLNDLPSAQDLYDAADEFEETHTAQFKKDAQRLDDDLESDAGSGAASEAPRRREREEEDAESTAAGPSEAGEPGRARPLALNAGAALVAAEMASVAANGLAVGADGTPTADEAAPSGEPAPGARAMKRQASNIRFNIAAPSKGEIKSASRTSLGLSPGAAMAPAAARKASSSAGGSDGEGEEDDHEGAGAGARDVVKELPSFGGAPTGGRGGRGERRDSTRSVENWLRGAGEPAAAAPAAPAGLNSGLVDGLSPPALAASSSAALPEDRRGSKESRPSISMVRSTVRVDGRLSIREADWQFSLVFDTPADKAKGMSLADFIPALAARHDEAQGGEAGGPPGSPAADQNPVAKALGISGEGERASVEVVTSSGARFPALVSVQAPGSEPPSPESTATFTVVVQRVGGPSPPAQAPPAQAPAPAPAPARAQTPPLDDDEEAEQKPKGMKIASNLSEGAKKRAAFASLDFHKVHRPDAENSSRGAGPGSEREDPDAGSERPNLHRLSSKRRPSGGDHDADGMSTGSAAQHSKWARKLARIKRRLAQAAGQDHSIGRMKKTVAAVIVVLIALAVVCYALMQNLIDTYWIGIVRVGTGGQRRLQAVEMAVFSLLLSLSGLPGWDPDGTLEAYARKKLTAAVNKLEEVHIELRDVEAQPDVKLSYVKTDAGAAEERLQSEWDMTFELVDAGREMAKVNPAEFRRKYPDFQVNPAFHFLYENGPEQAYERFMESNHAQEMQAFALFSNIRVFVICMVCIATVICVGLAVFFFRPKINAVQREKEEAIRLFFDIPKNVLHRIAKAGKKSAQSDDEEDEEFDLEDDDEDWAVLAKTARDGGKKKEGEKEEAEQAAQGREGAWKRALGAAAETMSKEELQKARRLWRVFHKDRRRVDGLSLRYTLAFAALFAAFFAWFLVAYLGSEECVHLTSERNLGGLRRSLAWQVYFHAIEIIAARQGAMGAQYSSHEILKHNREHFLKRVDMLEETCRHLLFGNPEEGLTPQVGRYAPRDVQLFGVPCIDDRELCQPVKGVVSSNGLHRFLMEFIEEARMLVRAPPETLVPTNVHYKFIKAAAEGPLEAMNVKANDINVEEAELILGAYLKQQQVMLGIVCAAVVLSYLFAFRVIISRVQEDARRTMFLLLMIPNEVLETVETIRQHLIRKAFAARDQAA
eukprot:tig00000339_g24185.t1